MPSFRHPDTGVVITVPDSKVETHAVGYEPVDDTGPDTGEAPPKRRGRPPKNPPADTNIDDG